VVITNQAGIARGYYDHADVAVLHQWMADDLAQQGIHIAGFYYCPHHPTAGDSELTCVCTCRKPAPGMLLEAAAQLNINLSASVMMGDKASDIEAGRAAGVGKTIRIHPQEQGNADFRAVSLLDAIKYVKTFI
jgi:D-glycero-D-manno-heptose 1,7-bisphosphate phosphatase